MHNIMGMMKKAEEMQKEIANLQATGISGGGHVTVVLNGQGHFQGIKIDPSLMKPEDSGILEDLIIAAHNEAKAKVEAAIASKTQEIMAGLPIPPGLKFLF
ncbi:MAG: hypothetical protein JSC085_000652 [Candidatus Tokpelaia sp. JSC085]|nr:MAG: hypothetical protein JSC085_000652 [Candidatus Tokpelaia sp. JSC085]